MIAGLKEFADRLLGRGDATITVPSFDGALKPNQILEQAEKVAFGSLIPTSVPASLAV